MIYYDPYHPQTNAPSIEEWNLKVEEWKLAGVFTCYVAQCPDDEWESKSKSLGLD